MSSPTLKDVISASGTTPLSKEEEQALRSLLQRKATAVGREVAIPVVTGGRPRHVSFVTKASKTTSEPSQRTMQRRHEAAMRLEEVRTGGTKQAQDQRAFSLQKLSKEEGSSCSLVPRYRMVCPKKTQWLWLYTCD